MTNPLLEKQYLDDLIKYSEELQHSKEEIPNELRISGLDLNTAALRLKIYLLRKEIEKEGIQQ